MSRITAFMSFIFLVVSSAWAQTPPATPSAPPAGDTGAAGGGVMDYWWVILLMLAIILLWDYVFNVLEFHFPRFRRIAQDSPTLLIHNGHVLERNLRREQLTEEELKASLRKQGIEDIGRVKQAILEVDGHISVIEKGDQALSGKKSP